MLTEILGVLSSGGFGAVIGLAGGWLTKREARKTLEVKNKFELDNREYDLKSQVLENDQQLAVIDKEISLAETEGDIRVQSIEADAFLASIKNQAIQTGVIFVDAVRGLMRPLITTYLLICTTAITVMLYKLLGGLESGMPVADASALFAHIIKQIVFLTVTSVSWWFASRPEKGAK